MISIHRYCRKAISAWLLLLLLVEALPSVLTNDVGVGKKGSLNRVEKFIKRRRRNLVLVARSPFENNARSIAEVDSAIRVNENNMESQNSGKPDIDEISKFIKNAVLTAGKENVPENNDISKTSEERLESGTGLVKMESNNSMRKLPYFELRPPRRRRKYRYYRDSYYSKKGKGKSSKSKKGKSSKGSKKKGKGGYSSKSKMGKKSKSNVCELLDFRDYYFGRIHEYNMMMGHRGDRQLQFEGEGCQPNTLHVIASDPDYSIFVDAVDAAGLDGIFDCAGPLTILAPNNDAWNKNPALLEYLFNHPEKLQQVLLYMMIPGFYLSNHFEEGMIGTLLGEKIFVNEDPLMFNQAEAFEVDNLACNGVIDGIDDVLIPDIGILPKVCEMLDYREPGQFPDENDDLIDGDDIFSGIFDRRRRLQYEGALCNPNMFEVLLSNPDTRNFAALLDAAGMSEIFLCAGPFTVLAPSNEALEAVDRELLEELLLPENRDRLQELLLYHIVPGYLPSSDLSPGPIDTLLFGEQVEVALDPPTFNQAGVVSVDNMGCNGVMHIIDDVLVPEEDFCDNYEFDDRRRLQGGGENCEPNIIDVARLDPDLSDIVTLFDEAGLTPIFDCAGPFTGLFPTNDALAAVDRDLLTFLLRPENLPDLQELLLYHVLPGETLSDDFSAGPAETLLQAASVLVSLNPLMFDLATVVQADVAACNGYINKIDMLLNPFPGSDQPSIVPGNTEEPTTQVLPDICSDYDFDRRRLQIDGTTCSPNILEIARQNPDLATLVQLVEIAGMEDLFRCPGPFTGFFPTNDAFAADQDIVDFLILPNNTDALQGLLLYHLLGGESTVADLATQIGNEIETLLPGENIAMGGSPSNVLVNDAGIVTPDVEACNGLIQVVDSILLPLDQEETGAPTPGITDIPDATDSPGTTASPTSGVTSITPSTGGPSFISTGGTAAPTGGSTSGSTIPDVLTIRVADFYIGYVATGQPEPTQDEYNAMVNATSDYFQQQFIEYFQNDPTQEFLGVTTSLRSTAFNVPGKPPDVPTQGGGAVYNIYMEYQFADFLYTDQSNPPDSSATYEIMRESLNDNYILNVVRPVGGPWTVVNEVIMRIVQYDITIRPS